MIPDMGINRVDSVLSHDDQLRSIRYHDKYVLVYDFSNVGATSFCDHFTCRVLTVSDQKTACNELSLLLGDIMSVGLNTEVRAGYDQTLLIFVQTPRDLLGNSVYRSR
jgi:anoctamin-10